MLRPVFAVCLLLATPAQAQTLAPDLWEAHLQVTDARSQARVSFGLRPDATDGFDALYEVPALWGQGVRAWFHHPGWPGGPAFVRDIGAGPLPARFELWVAGAAGAVTLTWRLQWVPVGCDRVDLFLVDPHTGQRLDLRRADRYSYASRAGEVRRFILEAEPVDTGPRPAAPTLRQGVVAGRSGQAILAWTAPVGAVPVVGYHVYRADGDGPARRLTDLPLYDTRFIDRSLPPAGGEVTYEVRALDDELCEGPPSDALSLPVPDRRGR